MGRVHEPVIPTGRFALIFAWYVLWKKCHIMQLREVIV